MRQNLKTLPHPLCFFTGWSLQCLFEYRQYALIHTVEAQIVGVAAVNGAAVAQIGAEKFFTIHEIDIFIPGIERILISSPDDFPAAGMDIYRGLIDISEIAF